MSGAWLAVRASKTASCPIIVGRETDLATRPSVPELFGVFSIPIGLSSSMDYFYRSPKRNARSPKVCSREWVGSRRPGRARGQGGAGII